MKPESDPANAVVVIVAVERSAVFPDDPLRGPVADAIRLFDWAVAQHVPTARIRLFVSAKDESRSLLDDWQPRRGDAVCTDATEAAIRNFLVGGLDALAPPPGTGGLLVVAWSGHGVVDTRSPGRNRQLFYEDSRHDLLLHIDVTGLLASLGTQRLRGFDDQVLIVDACATFASASFGHRSLGKATNLGSIDAAGPSRQFVMAAASPGQVAETEADASGVVASRFMGRLVHRLVPEAGQRWPDFGAAFAATRQAFAGDPQTPMGWAWGAGAGALTVDPTEILGTARATRLLRALTDTGLDDDALRAAFQAALVPIVAASTHLRAAQEGPAAMVTLLAQSPPAATGIAPPLLRFAFEIVARADEVAASGVTEWLKAEGCNAASIHVEVARCRAAWRRDVNFVLVVETPDGDEAASLEGWIFVGDPPQARPVVRPDDAPFVIDAAHPRDEVLGDFIGAALAACPVPGAPLVLEFALTKERLDDPLECTDFAEGIGTEKLRSRCLVVRRLAPRLRALQHPDGKGANRWLTNIAAWLNNAAQMRQRLDTHGLRLVELDPEALIDQRLAMALAEHPTGSCVVIQAATEAGRLTPAARKAVESAALPFACWADGPWSAADATCLQDDLGDRLGQDTLLRLYELQRSHAFEHHPSTRLVLFWDDPRRQPPTTRLQARRP
jgi:hypothetical protein